MRARDIVSILIIAILVGTLTALGVSWMRNISVHLNDRPLRLTVSRADAYDAAILKAFAQELQERRLKPGLTVVEVADAREAARALASGTSDLGVVRPDIETPNGTSAVLRLRAAPIILVTRKTLEVSSLADLEGRTVGLEARDSAILDEINAIFAQTQRKPAQRKLLHGEETESALAGHKVDVVLFTPSLTREQAGPALVRKLSASGTGFKVSAVRPDDVSAMIPSLPSVPIKESGLPTALREEDVEEVVCAAYVLMARNAVDRNLIASFTERMFYMRAAIAKRSGRPATFGSVSEDSVTATALPLHKGAIEYYEREQQTLLERYSDLIWFGIAFSGMLSSVFAWLVRRINRRRAMHQNNAFRDLQAFAAQMLNVSTAEILAVRDEAEFNALSARIVELAREGRLEDSDLTALHMAMEHARHALESARARVA